MGEWKNNKNKGPGPWNFTEQPSKWGYLNNPRWVGSPGTAVNYTDRPLDEPQVWTPGGGFGNQVDSNIHYPCGHWHKRQLYYPTIYLDAAFFQQSMDVLHGRIAMVGMNPNEPYGIVCAEYSVDNNTWYGLGGVEGISQYMEPHTLRISSENGYVAYFTSCYDTNTFNFHHLGVFKFARDNWPIYCPVWEGNDVDTFDDYQIFNVMDCYRDRIACVARALTIGGLVYAYWMVKVSNNAGENWNEWHFPTPTSSITSGGYYDRVQVRISQDQTVWLAYLRSSGSTGDHMIELWKSNLAGTSFSKVWETNFYATLGSEAYGFNFDIEDYGGERLIITLLGTSGGVYTQLIYALANFGTTVIAYTHAYSSADVPYAKGTANAPNIVHAEKGGDFLVSNNSGALFNIAVDGRVGGNYIDHQKHHEENVYTECGNSFDLSGDFIGFLYSVNNGLSWRSIETPFPLSAPVGEPLPLPTYPGYADEIVSDEEVHIYNLQTGDYVTWNTQPGMFQGRDYRIIEVTDVPWE